MDGNVEKTKRDTRKRFLIALLCCVGCVLVNFAGSKIAAVSGLPLYLDSIGTIISGICGGYVPGIICGYITNLITSSGDPASVYYCLVSILIAVAAAYMANHGWFSKPLNVLASILVFALIGGGMGTFISWCIYGLAGEWEPSEYALVVTQVTGISGYASQAIADILLDVVDKGITVVAVMLFVKLAPAKLRKAFRFSIWQQNPLDEETQAKVRAADTRSFSIRTKIVVVVAFVMAAVVAVTATMSAIMFFQVHVATQSNMGIGIAELMSDRINANRVDLFIEQGDAAPGYSDTEASLVAIRDRFPDVEYVYAYKIEEDGCHVVFDLDTEELQGEEPGTMIEFDETFLPYVDALLAGEPIDPIVSNDAYGWLLTVYQPVYDSAGNCACYVGIDVSMNHLVDDGIAFLIRLLILSAGFFLLVCIIVIWLANYCLILPINSIAHVTSNFAFKSEESRADNVKKLQDVDIRTGDELENLYKAVARTTEDTMDFIEEAHDKADTIERMQDNLIMVMADLVESRDKFTGDHVRKTAAYTKVIMEQLRRDGSYTEQLTDEFCENVVKSAPLHDIGKIVVSDTILNKPGKLTEEEFTIMKSHTTAGYEIIENAKGAVSEGSYLDEAQRLAVAHHEKWNGKGYPYGLAGEDIPLSARIMAVADVFDALISKRSYKEGMPMEKAFAIIRDGAGEQFDPLVAAAFLNAEEEVRKIAETHGDNKGTASDIRDESK